MGKYSDRYKDKPIDDIGLDNSLRLNIANELAEANRLKRLEIRVKINNSSIDMLTRKVFLNEVGDQA